MIQRRRRRVTVPVALSLAVVVALLLPQTCLSFHAGVRPRSHPCGDGSHHTIPSWSQPSSSPLPHPRESRRRRCCCSTSTTLSSSSSAAVSVSSAMVETIAAGRIAVRPEFLDPHEVAVLQRDAATLHADGRFTTDALASYGTSQTFDPAKDRAVLKLAQWKKEGLGDGEARTQFGRRMAEVRSELAAGLQRPNLVQGDSVQLYGAGSTEISYTRFGAGASLARHVDEHHEELKGVNGWAKPTRRSLSWLVYLNDPDWNVDRSGGCLRCYERRTPSARNVGARGTGDLQIGWLRASLLENNVDPFERPVFLQTKSGQCQMYIDGSDNGGSPYYISKPFPAHPTLFVAGSELLTQKLFIERRDLANRFHFIEPPKSKVTDWLSTTQGESPDERITDIAPTGGTLVVFDSVSLPHEVLPTVGRDRWAASGWFHEDQQAIEYHT